VRGAFWVGLGLLNVGGAYALIFLAMGAPWQIPAAAAAVAAVGLLCLAAAAVGVARRISLFRDAVVTTGVLEEMARPAPGATRPLFGISTELRYRFNEPQGGVHRAVATILWDDRFAAIEDGDPLDVLYHPKHPRRSLPVVALL